MAYTEDTFVEQPAIKLFQSLDWQTLNCWDEVFGEYTPHPNPLPEGEGTYLGRENRGDVLLQSRLHSALVKLNPKAPKLAIDEAILALRRDRSAMSAIAANEDLYALLKEGYKYVAPEENEDDVTVKIIDWQNPANNDFLLCSQMSITGEIETRRPDLLGFVNGLPLLFVELKASHRQLIHAFKDNLKDYRNTIPQLFWFNQLILLSNGMQSKVGTVSSQWEHFADWKKIASDKEKRQPVSLEVLIRGLCDKSRLLDMIENYVLYVKAKHTVKIAAKYHQFYGVNEALKGLEYVNAPDDEREGILKKGQLGVFWHTQGSGKSYSMVFFARKAFRKLPGNWTFVIVTDRTDLDDQIYKTFNAAGLVKEEAQASSGEDLKRLLSEDHRFVFTLIQKFGNKQGEKYPCLSERDDIIVITDEAHRSQYDTLAMNMRNALPNANFIAFTGTPLLKVGEEKTREVFGDYVSVYNFGDAIEDGATLPLYYENRVPEVNLNRDDLGDAIVDILDEADLSDEQEAKLESEFAKAYHIITREERLDTVAKDIVDHYMGREPFSDGRVGKAMVVSIDKATAIRMYNKVQREWGIRLDSLRNRLKYATGSHQRRLQEQIDLMQSTDMAVVVSGGQGDYERLEKMGLDFKPHRERMKNEKLDEKFKEPDHSLRIVFVCAMWLTGFDAPSVSTLYLDKPLKSHTLMQTIARANRVFPGKVAGQIVDYINIFGALQNALGVYGGGVRDEPGIYGNDDSPMNPKDELLQALVQAFDEVRTFLQNRGISLSAIIDASEQDFSKQRLIRDACELLLLPQNYEAFVAFVRQINRIFKAILPDSRADVFSKERVLLNVLYKTMREGMGEQVDDEDVLNVVRTQVNELLDEAIETVHIGDNLPNPINIADIDFDALYQMLLRIKKPTPSEIERLRRIIEKNLSAMLEQNASKTRQELTEKFKELVEQYNLGASAAEKFFEDLKDFVKDLDEEQQRAGREGLGDEELAIFDLLCSEVPLPEKERDKVKAIAKELIEKVKTTLVIDWRKKQRTKARVRNVIEDVLDSLPETYSDDIWPKACDDVHLHVYDKYVGEGRSVYQIVH